MMKRQAIRGLVLSALSVAVVISVARAQNTPDAVTVRDRKDGGTKTHNGKYQVSAAGFQVVSGPKGEKVVTIDPDDVVKVVIGDLAGVERNAILAANTKEEKGEFDAALTTYQDLLKKGGLPERSRRFVEFKKVLMTNKIVDELDYDKGWKEKAAACVKDWNLFLAAPDTKSGWEQWPAVRACTRLQIELGDYEDAARTWGQVSKNANMPPDARAEAALQEIDLQIRAKAYSNAVTAAGALLKTAAGPRKDRLAIYEIAARAGNGKPLEGIAKIKAVMDKTKDHSVHATGFSMTGELYLAGGKPRDAMWEFLMVATVLNQDKDEAFKALSRLAALFEAQMDEEQANKYREKLKRFRSTF